MLGEFALHPSGKALAFVAVRDEEEVVYIVVVQSQLPILFQVQVGVDSLTFMLGSA